MKVYFAVITEAGDIVRTGSCNIEDVELQGEIVWSFDADPELHRRLHGVDLETGAVTLKPVPEDAP